MHFRLSAHDRIRLAAAAVASPDTVERYYRDPTSVRSTSAARIERAARELGLPLPTPHRDAEPHEHS
jgi:DNA-binding LacI/PurR family transcriptional regulator